MNTPVEVGQTEAEIALMLEKEIDKRVIQALYRVFAPCRIAIDELTSTISYSERGVLAESIIDAGQTQVKYFARQEVKDAIYKISQTL
jgi:hypothetical protein